MKGIGGTMQIVIEVSEITKNAIHEEVVNWKPVQTLKGWLDTLSGDARYSTYYAKVSESTHVFIADFVPLDSRITVENARAKVNGKTFDITQMDNPMELGAGSQWEIYLRHTGGV